MKDSLVRLTDFVAISPLLLLLFGSLLVLILESFMENFAKKASFYVALIFLTGAFVAGCYVPQSTDPLLTPWLRFDALSQFFTLFFLTIGILVTLLSASFFKRFEASVGEYYFLLLSAVFGLILIGSAADFLTLFLGIETLSLSLYVWCGYMKKWEISYESALKYFLMGSMAAAFFLYGVALIYGATGTTNLASLHSAFQGITTSYDQTLFLSGIAFITVGLAFEAAVVPFHVWAPDVYAGAPTPVTAFMSVGTKAGAFAAFILLFLFALPQFDERWNQGVALLAGVTLIYANFVALQQTQLRRFFAYSGISHAGFLLIPIVAGTPDSLSALKLYLVTYTFATLGAFAVLSFLDQGEEGISEKDLKGLFQKSPWLAIVFALCFLTLAGIPPTAGFFAKFYVFKVAFQSGYNFLIIIGLLTTILSAYYYLRFIALMFSGETEYKSLQESWPATVVSLFSFIVLCWLIVYPYSLLNFLF